MNETITCTQCGHDMKIIKINGIDCIVQAHLEGDFVNLCPINCELDSIRVDFNNQHPFHTSGKETQEWKEFVSEIDIKLLAERLKQTFAPLTRFELWRAKEM